MSQTAENFYLAFAQGREPDSDEPEMESSLHYDQLALLVSTLEWHWRDRDDFFIGANRSVYFRRDQCKPRELRGPDFFLVRGVERRPRRSWTVWLEDGRYPDLIIELLSDETARSDRTAKKALYEGVFRTPEYFWFSPQTKERLRAEQERDHAAAERLRADAQSNRADRLAARLRALGVDPEGA